MQTSTCQTIVDEYFRRKGFRRRLRGCLLSPYWNDLIATMRSRGYSRHVIYATIRHALWFSEFAAEMGVVTASCLTDKLVVSYHETRPQHPRMAKESRRYLKLLTNILREHGVMPPVRKAPPPPAPRILTEYLRFLVDHRGICDRTTECHRVHVEKFLQSLGSPDPAFLAGLDSPTISRFITTRASTLCRSERKLMCAADISSIPTAEGHPETGSYHCVPGPLGKRNLVCWNGWRPFSYVTRSMKRSAKIGLSL